MYKLSFTFTFFLQSCKHILHFYIFQSIPFFSLFSPHPIFLTFNTLYKSFLVFLFIYLTFLFRFFVLPCIYIIYFLLTFFPAVQPSLPLAPISLFSTPHSPYLHPSGIFPEHLSLEPQTTIFPFNLFLDPSFHFLSFIISPHLLSFPPPPFPPPLITFTYILLTPPPFPTLPFV